MQQKNITAEGWLKIFFEMKNKKWNHVILWQLLLIFANPFERMVTSEKPVVFSCYFLP